MILTGRGACISTPHPFQARRILPRDLHGRTVVDTPIRIWSPCFPEPAEDIEIHGAIRHFLHQYGIGVLGAVRVVGVEGNQAASFVWREGGQRLRNRRVHRGH